MKQIEEGQCIFPIVLSKNEKKIKTRPCGKPVVLRGADGKKMLFCAEHQKRVLEAMSQWRQGKNKKGRKYVVAKGFQEARI